MVQTKSIKVKHKSIIIILFGICYYKLAKLSWINLKLNPYYDEYYDVIKSVWCILQFTPYAYNNTDAAQCSAVLKQLEYYGECEPSEPVATNICSDLLSPQTHRAVTWNSISVWCVDNYIKRVTPLWLWRYDNLCLVAMVTMTLMIALFTVKSLDYRGL